MHHTEFSETEFLRGLQEAAQRDMAELPSATSAEVAAMLKEITGEIEYFFEQIWGERQPWSYACPAWIVSVHDEVTEPVNELDRNVTFELQ